MITHQQLVKQSKELIGKLLDPNGLPFSEQQRLGQDLQETQAKAREVYDPKGDYHEYKPLDEITVPEDPKESEAKKFTKQIKEVNSTILTLVQDYDILSKEIARQGNQELLYVLLDKRRELVKGIISSYEYLINLLKNASENPSFSPAQTQILGKLLTVYIGPKEAQNRLGVEFPSSQNIPSYREWLKIYQEDLSLALKRNNPSDDERRWLNKEFASNNKKLKTIEPNVSQVINHIKSDTNPTDLNKTSSSNTFLPRMGPPPQAQSLQAQSPQAPSSTDKSPAVSSTPQSSQPSSGVLQASTGRRNYTIIYSG